MLVQIRHDGACKERFDIFCGGKKLKSGEEYPLPQKDLRLKFVERNPLMSKFWFFRALALFVAGILSGNFSDLKDARRARTEIEVRLSGVGEDLEITFTESGYTIYGAQEQEKLSQSDVPLPQVSRRIRAYKITIVSLGLAAAAGVLAWLILSLT